MVFEKLAGNVLSKILSEYFTDESLAKNKATKTAYLGIWSGYISLQNLVVKKDIINAKLRRKGQPFELVHCFIRQVEITIPWAKLSNPISKNHVVLVLDGIHAILRVSFTFHDEELRDEEIEKRRKALSRSETFVKSSTEINDDNNISLEDNNMSYTEMFKQRITSGITQEIAEKLHIHIRDLHVRIEDNESDPENPFAFGITMESMHVQQDNNKTRNEQTHDYDDYGRVAKVAQINHFAAYWNALEYGHNLPPEHSVLHEIFSDNPGLMSEALDLCIIRRGSIMASSSKASYIPTHTFILLPVGGQIYFLISNTPKVLTIRPAIDITIELDCVSTNLRDFQCVQMLRLDREQKNFQFVKKHRKFRPKSSVMANPKAWWFYATRVIKAELRESYLRWSWSRFRKKYSRRSRYMKLYEIRIRNSNKAPISSLLDDDTGDNLLTAEEAIEIEDMEDGRVGDMSVSDIILYRALVKMKNGCSSCVISTDTNNQYSGSSWWKETVQNAASGDIEAREEFDKLLQYIEEVRENEVIQDINNDSLTAISVTIKVEIVRFELFSPLYITTNETQVRRLHEKFFDLISQGVTIRGSLKGDYKKFGVEFSVSDFTAFEIRKDKSQHVVARQIREGNKYHYDRNNNKPNDEEAELLFSLSFVKNPSTNSGVNKELRMLLNSLEIDLNPDCQWLAHLKSITREISTVPTVDKFWGEISIAYLNSLALGKLGILAKAESTASHENLDVNINMHCPIIRIGMGDTSDLVVDLGVLSLKTDKLAGVSCTKFNKLPDENSIQDDLMQSQQQHHVKDEKSPNGDVMSKIPSSIFPHKVSPQSFLRRPLQNFIISSAMSIESLQISERESQSFSSSFKFDDAFPSIEDDSGNKDRKEQSNIEELFYDKYQLLLHTGKIIFIGENEIFDISPGTKIRTTIQKSVIPSDHTLCKLLAHTVVGRIKFVLNENLFSRFGAAILKWKSLFCTDAVNSQPYRHGADNTTKLIRKIGPSIQDFAKISMDDTSNADETDSIIDEDEFFDAREGRESSEFVSGDNSGIWFEDNWIADAESVIDGGNSGGSLNGRRYRRRQSSISDVSSMSDHSKNRKSAQNKYLSAENLARLEEGVGEDDSIAESRNEMDDDSFHSVLSSGGQVKLLSDLEDTMRETEININELSATLVENARYLSNINDVEIVERRFRRKRIKQNLDRSKAELKVMKALSTDLKVLLSDAQDKCDSNLDIDELTLTAMQHARTAKSIIREKKRRDSTTDDQDCHMMIKNLNRELFKGSIIMNEIHVLLCTGKDTSDALDVAVDVDCDLKANQVALALFHYANDTKAYFSLDQMTASVSTTPNDHNNSTLLFSGGSSDTVLPVQLPHLVAHSMEDRFLRGVLDLRKCRFDDSFQNPFKSFKLRLVVGDVEVMPFQKYMTPICEHFLRVKAVIALFKTPSQETGNSSLETIEKNQKVKRVETYYDIALRLTSIRLGLTLQDQIVSAAVISESSLRLLQLASKVRNRTQIDLRCTNAQVLDIENIETGSGFEIFGRKDPFSSLFQLRLRSQLVHPTERSGWVVGSEKRQRGKTSSTLTVRNIHLGIKISPFSLLASSYVLSKLSQSVRELHQTIPTADSGKTSCKKSKESFIERMAREAPLRWRIDIVLRRINIKFLEEHEHEWNTSDDIGIKMLMAFTTVISIQDSSEFKGRMSVRIGVTDISLIRFLDDWPILEPFSVLFELVMMNQFISHLTKYSNDDILPLMIKVDSSLNEIDAVMSRYGWNSLPSRSETYNETWTIVLKISPIKVNTSISIIGLLADTFQSFKQTETKRMEMVNCESRPVKVLLPSPFGVQILIDDLEIELLKTENESKPIAYASHLISFTMTDVNVDYSQGEQIIASVLIRDSALFDLSSGKGVRVIGEDPEARIDFPYFVRVKFLMHFDGIQTIRLHINWGRIQCLVLPSFFQSILDLHEGYKKARGVSQGPNSKQKEKLNTLARFLYHPKDVNLILSADAETFECILSSRDIIEYVKNGDKDPCGVVTFRWKASLSLALALDCLDTASMPWLTLNLDGSFTDDDDVNLFKDFSSRFFKDFLFRNGESCYKLANAFTGRLNYKLSGFQALRTNIIQANLVSSPYRTITILPRICFKISQPVAGEQRITNPIDLELLYRATGVSMVDTNATLPVHYEVKLSQLIHLKANFVDVLLYIGTKSSGGFSDSYRVSIKPILNMLKQKDSNEALTTKSFLSENIVNLGNAKMPKLIDLMKTSSSIFRIEIEGLLVTCVPGGATRLNESPIIKFELSNLSSGFAAVLTNQNYSSIVTRGEADQHNHSSRHYINGSEIMNMQCGGNLQCQVTGHYHNRRLVAWEPLIEVWTADVRFGINLVEVCRFQPIIKKEPDISRVLVQTEPPTDENSGNEPSEYGKDRLREIGRLIRSPFQSNQSSSNVRRKGSSTISHSDLCYLMLSSSARTTILSALYASSKHLPETEFSLFDTIPSHAPMEWLSGFGQPTSDFRDAHNPFSISVVVSDKIPLNLNLTGAFIENVVGYLENAKRNGFTSVVPHLIRNASGMTIRFRECLDTDRSKRGETAAKIILSNGSEAPLTLKRSLSQTCDPHRAYIYLELGEFEDTVGRMDLGDYEIPKGNQSANFVFKATAKIPVDAVGVHRYPLDQNIKTRANVKANSNSRALGWIIVRVALRESVKVVSIESPFVLKSAADSDILCEVRDESGLSLLWRCLVPKEEGSDKAEKSDGIVSIPADIVPFIHDGSYHFSVTALPRHSSFSHESQFFPVLDNKSIDISVSSPFAHDSFGRGLIGEEEIILPVLAPPQSTYCESSYSESEKVHLTSCAIRLGNAGYSHVDPLVEVPEQRMIFFRSPLVVQNFLALPIAIQVRVETISKVSIDRRTIENGGRNRAATLTGWEELGVLDCGESVHWTGSLSSDRVQLRLRFVGTDGDNSRRYPGWSSPVNIPARKRSNMAKKVVNSRTFAKMRVADADNVTLDLSIAFEFGNGMSGFEQPEDDNIRQYCQKFSSATRAAYIFVPYWIIDSTNQDLEFFAGSPVAGQLSKGARKNYGNDNSQKFGNTLGLAELMDNRNFLKTSSGSELNVLMIGDENATRLTVRKRLARNGRLLMQHNALLWSDSVPLKVSRKTRHDLTVLIPDEMCTNDSRNSDEINCFDRLVLRSSITQANDKFGGKVGTKFLHIVNRYSVMNETGRDIRIAANAESDSNFVVHATSSPHPFHFDDSRPISFRFVEYGWAWSGSFIIRLNRREVTMRLRHKMKGQAVIVTIEVRSFNNSATNLIVFRESNHPPFRLENLTMYPINFSQAFGMGGEEKDFDSLLLQYQKLDFAWDQPEMHRRILILRASNKVFGRFPLDKIAPGTELKLDSDLFTAEIVADGPTRVLRVSDASMPRISSVQHEEFEYTRRISEISKPLTISLSIRISHGVGISVVDFSPKELIYIYLEDIELDKNINNEKSEVHFSIGKIKLNNQLWVTPYPVLLKMGHRQNEKHTTRKRNRRHNAISIAWCSSLNTHGGYGNVTLLDRIEVSSEPIFANVDGELAGLLYSMTRQIACIRSSNNDNNTNQTRDEELKSLLAINGVEEYAEDADASPGTHDPLHNEATGELLATAAIASKLKSSNPFYNQLTTHTRSHYLLRNFSRRKKKQPLSKVQHKLYIEKLKISTIKADLSWSGVLPGLLSSSLFKALTFERLPVRLRQFSSSHAYGNVEDHLQILKSHYVSIWRIFDLLIGITSNPMFLFRAIVHTFREGCASTLNSWAVSLTDYSAKMTKFLPQDSKFLPIYDDGNTCHEFEQDPLFLKRVFAPFVNGVIFTLKNTSFVITLFSLQMKYSPKNSSVRQTLLVRSRNPRLFAHLHGKDLLVEYVEGENAGKALLSRVRAGLHLGEGYLYHAEGARELKLYYKSRNDLNQMPLILMVTLERILLLTGRLNETFCSVEWEAYLTNVIHVDLLPAKETPAFPFDEIIVWHLSDPEFSVENKVSSGIDVLQSRSIFVPRHIGEQLLRKIRQLENRFD